MHHALSAANADAGVRMHVYVHNYMLGRLHCLCKVCRVEEDDLGVRVIVSTIMQKRLEIDGVCTRWFKVMTLQRSHVNPWVWERMTHASTDADGRVLVRDE